MALWWDQLTRASVSSLSGVWARQNLSCKWGIFGLKTTFDAKNERLSVVSIPAFGRQSHW